MLDDIKKGIREEALKGVLPPLIVVGSISVLALTLSVIALRKR